MINLNRVYSENISLIFKFNIDEVLLTFEDIDLNDMNYKYVCNEQGDEEIISEFYYKHGRKEYNADFVKFLYCHGSVFHSIRRKDAIIAGMWIHCSYLFLCDPSFFVFQNKRDDAISFNGDVIYSGHNIIDEKFRGKHLYSLLLFCVLKHYSGEKKSYIYMTGIESVKMINSAIKHNAKLIAIIKYKRILSFIWKKKELYMDKREKCWRIIN